MKKQSLIIILAVFGTSWAWAQADDARAKFDAFGKKIRKEYSDFRQKANEEYAEFMMQAWKSYGAEPPIMRPKEEPIPPVVMPEKERQKPIKSRPIQIEEVVVPPAPTPQPVPIFPLKAQPRPKLATLPVTIDKVTVPTAPTVQPVTPDIPQQMPKQKPLNAQPISIADGNIPTTPTVQPVTPDIPQQMPKQKPLATQPISIADGSMPTTPDAQPVTPTIELPAVEYDYVSFTFYGTECDVRFDNSAHFRLADCSNQTLADTWLYLTDGKIDNLLYDCLQLRDTLQLSDYAYINLLQTMAEACMGKGNEAVFLAANAFCQSGYSMRLGRKDDKLFLLYASKYDIYNHAFYSIDGKKYYPLGSEEKQMEICDVAYPGEQPLSLLIAKEQRLTYEASEARQLTSRRYPEVSAQVSVNKNLIDFYNGYPSSMFGWNFLTRWAIYANTAMAEQVRETLYPALRKQIEGLGEREAANKLLNWVQTAFKYEYDEKVWGQDRAFFAEESLFYPYCDCEDRSILFSRLVRDLLGLKVVLVYYPNHLATAVEFTEEVEGDYIKHQGSNYVICDPTYIGAPVGRTMKSMDNLTARVILLDN